MDGGGDGEEQRAAKKKKKKNAFIRYHLDQGGWIRRRRATPRFLD